jgi:2-amino-4,5-dihydroxy-6-oxo-7-(phosphooxy)heptanoate synthase
MFETDSVTKKMRLLRLFRKAGERLFIVPLDHIVTTGPIADAAGTAALVRTIAANGADAVVLHKGRVRFVDPACFQQLSLVIHISASTVHADDVNAKTVVASVEECIRLGADAVSIHINMGSPTEAVQLADLARAAEACGRWNMPLLAMVYPRGPRIGNPHDPDLVAHAVNLASELGADIVKTVYTGSVDTMSQVVRTCPIPVLAAGGAKMTDPGELAMFMRDVLRSGARGVAMGRNVFEAEQPGEIVKVVAGMIDDPAGLLQYI